FFDERFRRRGNLATHFSGRGRKLATDILANSAELLPERIARDSQFPAHFGAHFTAGADQFINQAIANRAARHFDLMVKTVAGRSELVAELNAGRPEHLTQ